MKRENAIETVQRIVAEIHAPTNLRYQADLNSVTAYFTKNKIQCQSATYLAALIWFEHAHHYPDAEWVFIHTPGHVKSGLLIDEKLYAMESLLAHPTAVPYDDKKELNVRALRGKEELVALLYKAAGRTSPYTEEERIAFEKVEGIDSIVANSAAVIPLSSIGLPMDQENAFEYSLDSSMEKVVQTMPPLQASGSLGLESGKNSIGFQRPFTDGNKIQLLLSQP